MSLSVDNPIFNEMYEFLIMYKQSNFKNSCAFLSTLFAKELTKYKDRVFIVDSATHAVVYDGKNTWDLGLGIVLFNYKYPRDNPPKPTILPAFKTYFKPEYYGEMYSDKAIKEAKTIVAVTEVRHMGAICDNPA